QLFSNQVADQIPFAHETEQRALVLKAGYLDDIAQLVPIKSPRRGQYHAVAPSAVQLMRQPDAAFGRQFLKLEEMRSERQHRRDSPNQRERDTSFGGQKSFGLDLHRWKEFANLDEAACRRRIRPAANQSEPWTDAAA